MCNHIFVYPTDAIENYNSDGKTLTGVCKCGAKQKAYGLRWSTLAEESFYYQTPYGESLIEFDKSEFIC